MQKIERLVAITLLLQARGKMTATRLANILGVSTRTIYRDIMALSLAHVPVSMDYGPGGGYYLPDDYHFESAIFTREEAISLILSADIAGNHSLFAGDDDLHRALFKLEAALPEEYRAGLQAAREHILIDTTAWRDSSMPTAYLETIRSAVLHAYQLDILYPCTNCDGKSGMHWQRVDPYGLVFKMLSRRHIRTGVWYLVAYCHTCQSFCTFRVGHIEKLKVRQERIKVKTDFDLRTYWRKARRDLEEQAQPLKLMLRVTPSARQGLGGNCSVLKEEADGSAIVSVDLDSVDAAISYALGLGADATVLSPTNVREAVATTAQAIAEMYAH
ncbi:MAG: YafY family transcriptional regulator [Chloroflexi bacterium]|nr:YafY family transcriptional regulator [Chloroflexota bacterium]